ncbi:NAD(P)H-binding protein [Nocardiopsis sp. RSe5-2]|uniref:NAD(P)H-binding protein n=1 Tax=Nocardiopsis endophytica TaxID=3018445 RepID=A0ABT4U1L0_9ACTN|nr:NAD(P)H-binding protein [Nocardiopsis endophytica]MDA2810842.1 NAD(P)H-binding protein [Nocardiopsis endophytica]
MEKILITGGTGTLGKAVVRRVLEGGREVRVLSRRPGSSGEAERVVGDLRTGDGVAEAVSGVDTIVHCATTLGRDDVRTTRLLAEAARDGGAKPHLIYISIAGIDTIPLSYYRTKLATEHVVKNSGLPWTILRTTQFHDLIARMFSAQRALPVTAVLSGVRFQPVDVRVVAERMAALAEEGESGRVPDLGGPEIRTMADLARAYRARPVAPLPLFGKTVRAFRAGDNLVPGNAVDGPTFEEFLAGR